VNEKNEKDKSQSLNISAALTSFVPVPTPNHRHSPGIQDPQSPGDKELNKFNVEEKKR